MFKSTIYYEIVSKVFPTKDPVERRQYGGRYTTMADATNYISEIYQKHYSAWSLCPLEWHVVRSNNEMEMIVKISGPRHRVRQMASELIHSPEFRRSFSLRVVK